MDRIHRKYRSLFSLKVSHDYFQKGVCGDFLFFPLAQTERDLKRFRLILKPIQNGAAQPDGLQVLQELRWDADAPTPEFVPLLDLPMNAVFTFGMRLINQQHINFTMANQVPNTSMGEHLLFENTTRVNGTEVLELNTTTFSSNEFAQQTTWGLINIHVNALTSGPTDYEIQFQKRSAHWQYFLVEKQPRPGQEHDIRSKQNGGPLFSLIYADPATPPFAPLSQPQNQLTLDFLRTRYPLAKISVFQSDAPIAYQEVPTQHFSLIAEASHTGAADAIRIDALPLPSTKQVKPEVILNLDG